MKLILKGAIALLLSATLFQSCKKEEKGYVGDYPDKAKLMFVNASLNADTRPGIGYALREVAIFPYYNGIGYNLYPIKFPWGNGYKVFDPGNLTLRLDTAWSPGNDPQYDLVNGERKYRDFIKATVKTLNLNLQANSYYTVFAIGNVKSNTVGSLDTLMVKDNISFPSSPDKVKVRFFNFSNSGPIDVVDVSPITLFTNPNGVVIYSNLTYADRSKGYIEIPGRSYDLRIVEAGTNTPIRMAGSGSATGTGIRDYAKQGMSFDPNSVFTVYITGFKTQPAPGVNTSQPGQLIDMRYHANRFSY